MDLRFAASIEYDGSLFCGWQSQQGVPTVQDAVESALTSVADQPVKVVAAGRTDTGVHSIGQIIHFDSQAVRTEDAWLRGGNTHLPPGVSIIWVKSVDDHFHARFGAIERAYRYIILNRPVRPSLYARKAGWDYRYLDCENMQQGAACLVGKHDFSSFRAAGCQASSPCRHLRVLDIHRHGEWVWFDVVADAFLHHMVRNLVGTLSSVGAGLHPPGWIRDVLMSRERSVAGVTAMPDGLYLVRVDYPSQFKLPPPAPICRFW
ncbi:MAG: tRNA pseudouridine(38-40) synthase TruA [Arenicellales bacterium]|jgi:tRNA pseudouridine38-40 synthase|nr:tRNA pseudouridine(38-40) synthase TruA [Arenicellales bacterium]